MVYEYSKHKDKKPEDTIAFIEKAMGDLGLELEYKTFASVIPNCCSSRVTVKGTLVGANGKGTSPLYCKASAYAELMERLQNQHYSILLSDQDKELQFYSLKKHEVNTRSRNYLLRHCGSNGMCAGNTPEEALTQGFAEVLERYCQMSLLRRGLTPPEIPRDYLRKYPSLLDTIAAIEKGGRYTTKLYDASLGEGFPVVAAAIFDTQTGKFGVKFAAHPSFAIAVERTLTEAFQNRGLEKFTAGNYWGDSATVFEKSNLYNVLTSYEGAYPATFFTETPVYNFTPFDDKKDMSNRDMLKYLTDMIYDRGFDILIRDTSFLGMPSYYIVVPGMSEIFVDENPAISALFQAIMASLAPKVKSTETIGNQVLRLAELERTELETVYNYSKSLSGNKMATRMGALAGRHFTGGFPGEPLGPEYMQALILYSWGDEQEALQKLRYILGRSVIPARIEALSAMINYLSLKETGLPLDKIRHLLELTFTGSTAEKTCYILNDPSQTLSRVYPVMKCASDQKEKDCDNCAGRAYCCQREMERFDHIIAEAEAANPIEQARVAEVFNWL